MAWPASSKSRELGLEFWNVRVAQRDDDGSVGNQLMQYPEQLGRQRNAGEDDARNITTRPVKACDQAGSHRIGTDDEYDWCCRGCDFACLRGRRAGAYDRGHLFANKIGR